VNIGGDHDRGKQAVVEACEASSAHLHGVMTTLRDFRVIVADASVVIVSAADYLDGDGTSTVASCDIYDFAGERGPSPSAGPAILLGRLIEAPWSWKGLARNIPGATPGLTIARDPWVARLTSGVTVQHVIGQAWPC
jgi:hypothetical protein